MAAHVFHPAAAAAAPWGAAAVAATATGSATTTRTAAEQNDAVAADFRGVALVAVLVVPLARLQAAFHVNLLAFGEIFGERFGGLAPQHDAVPFGFFLPLPLL